MTANPRSPIDGRRLLVADWHVLNLRPPDDQEAMCIIPSAIVENARLFRPAAERPIQPKCDPPGRHPYRVGDR